MLTNCTIHNQEVWCNPFMNNHSKSLTTLRLKESIFHVSFWILSCDFWTELEFFSNNNTQLKMKPPMGIQLNIKKLFNLIKLKLNYGMSNHPWFPHRCLDGMTKRTHTLTMQDSFLGDKKIKLSTSTWEASILTIWAIICCVRSSNDDAPHNSILYALLPYLSTLFLSSLN